MAMFRIIFSFIMPLGTWLLLGTPALSIPGNIMVFSVMIIFELGWLWLRPLSRILRGDQFTYGHVSAVFASLGLGLALAIGFYCFFRHKLSIHSINEIGSPALFGWLVSFVIVWIIPILSSSLVTKLPASSERRKFQDPV